MTESLPIGKIPPQLLNEIIHMLPTGGKNVRQGPGIGLDCAVLQFDQRCLVFKSEPITFVSQEIGWYAVQIAANDIATTGAKPAWMLLTALFPEGQASPEFIRSISEQVASAAEALGISIIGGHTEVTHGINRPILISTMIGEIECSDLVSPNGAQPGNHIILTKSVPIEATAIISREFPEKISTILLPEQIENAKKYTFDPGVSILKDAQIACSSGKVTAMHDPTEGGVATALWELAEACQSTLIINTDQILVTDISTSICEHLGLDPLGTIASGALLIASTADSSEAIVSALKAEGIYASKIGDVRKGPVQVFQETSTGLVPLSPFARDEITKLYE
jgi:hydrogenase expression/formation protein HypE